MLHKWPLFAFPPVELRIIQRRLSSSTLANKILGERYLVIKTLTTIPVTPTLYQRIPIKYIWWKPRFCDQVPYPSPSTERWAYFYFLRSAIFFNRLRVFMRERPDSTRVCPNYYKSNMPHAKSTTSTHNSTTQAHEWAIFESSLYIWEWSSWTGQTEYNLISLSNLIHNELFRRTRWSSLWD